MASNRYLYFNDRITSKINELKEELTNLFRITEGGVFVDITPDNNSYKVTFESSSGDDAMSYGKWYRFLVRSKLQDNSVNLLSSPNGEGLMIVKKCASIVEIERYIKTCEEVLRSLSPVKKVTPIVL